MVKNEELIQSGVSALEYLRLVKGTGGNMGGTVCRWLRVGRAGAFGLRQLAAASAHEMFVRLTDKDVDALSEADRAQLLASLGLLSYACDTEGMHGLLAHNLELALREMGERAGGDEGLAQLKEEGLVALAVTTWGAAPVQSGGRAAERKYVDIIVHLSPVDAELWSSGARWREGEERVGGRGGGEERGSRWSLYRS
jgi:hypothetical protein